MRFRPNPICLLVLGASLLSGCVGGQATRHFSVATGGYSHRGEKVVAEYRCGKCHEIPGIRNANGAFGPPLNAMARRSYIAGEFPNNPQNLTRWVMSPRSMKPKTAMPDLGLSNQQARDVTAFLETLH
ncbi:MAG: c-type cytochrome [Acidobacteriaceae bacterium]